MAKEKKRKTQTKRILELYHLFLTCLEVSREEMRQGLSWNYNEKTKEWEFWNDRTISRDLTILKYAGVPILYSSRRKAFIQPNKVEEKYPEKPNRYELYAQLSKKEQQYIERIKRLIKIMEFVTYHEAAVEVWYRKTFPNKSMRTMQRDFKTLKDVKEPCYNIIYKRGWEYPDEPYMQEDELPLGHYYLVNEYDIWRQR